MTVNYKKTVNMKSVATDKLTTANLHKCVNQDKMIKTEHTLVLKMLKYS